MQAESYVTIFLNSAYAAGNITAPLALFFLFLARFLPIVGLSPFFGSKVLPHPVKMTFALSMFFVFLPQLLVVTKTQVDFNVPLLFLMAKELFIGFCFGFMISIPFMIVQSVGIYVDHQRGGASLMVQDPTLQNQASPLGTLFNLILINIFFMLNGPFLFIDAIVSSYDIIPPDRFLSAEFFDKSSSYWQLQFVLLERFMSITIRLAAPALLAVLMTDLFLGIINRLAPQVQITFLGMPLKSLLALAVIFVGWKAFSSELGKEVYYWINTIADVIKSFKPATA